MDEEPEDRQEQVNDVVRRGLVLLVGFAVVVALGTFVVVHALGLNGADRGSPAAVGQPAPATPLPTTALPEPSSSAQPGASASSSPSASASASSQPGPRHHAAHGLQLNASPVRVGPMQRINLTGIWPGHDNVSLQVQERKAGRWTDFPVSVAVDMGTFATSVRTQITGLDAFRVIDPSTGTASNPVSINVG